MKKIYFLAVTLVCLGTGVSQAQYSVLLTFGGKSSPQGANPWGSLTSSGHKLYGMTSASAADSFGCVFSMDSNGGAYKDLLDFNGPKGAEPQFGTLTLSGAVLYGMTYAGGIYGGGNIFSIDTDGTNYKDMYDFGTTDPNPTASLTVIGDKLYGMTPYGGPGGYGNIFYIYKNGTGYTDIHDFGSGAYPYGSLTLVGNKFYGGTTYAGSHSLGNIFSIDTTGLGYKDIFDFSGTNGQNPEWGGALTYSNGKLYGLAEGGGAHTDGCIFSLDTNGNAYKDMLDFSGTSGPDFGAQPSCALTLIGSTLYGATPNGGANSGGSIYSIDTNGTGFTDLYDFNTPTGTRSYGSLTLAGDEFYGMTQVTQVNGFGNGVVFKFRAASVTTSVNELPKSSNPLTVYPNPSTGMITVEWTVNSPEYSGEVRISVMDELGQVVYGNSYQPSANSHQLHLNLENLSTGIYFVRLQSDVGSTVRKVMIEHNK